MATFKRFEDIIAWQLADELCKEINKIANQTPLFNDFKMRDQICASSDSIKSNIAEGFGRTGNREFLNFLHIAHASCAETQSQLGTIHNRGYITEIEFEHLHKLARRTSIAIYRLIEYLQKSPYRGLRYRDQE